MKFVMNGGLILGTLDGANVEIRDECGHETMFIFGAKEQAVEAVRHNAKQGIYPVDQRMIEALNFIKSGALTKSDHGAQEEFNNLANSLIANGGGQISDYYILCHDFPDYCAAQMKVDETYANKPLWWQLSIKAAASTGKFNSDRTVQEYASHVWNLASYERPQPDMNRNHSTPTEVKKVVSNAPPAASVPSVSGGPKVVTKPGQVQPDTTPDVIKVIPETQPAKVSQKSIHANEPTRRGSMKGEN